MKKSAFTLAEVLITLMIIGIVAALSIPSVITNAQQQEFKTGLKKAVSVLNEAIQTNIVLEGETPYENQDLFAYIKRHMSIVSSDYRSNSSDTQQYGYNKYFFTTDGMRFEFPVFKQLKLHESDAYASWSYNVCGSYGLASNPNNTTASPCFILVDVNGDKKPNPIIDSKLNKTYGNKEYFANYSYPSPTDKKLTDVFNILITDEKAIPFGVVAQRAMYQK